MKTESKRIIEFIEENSYASPYEKGKKKAENGHVLQYEHNTSKNTITGFIKGSGANIYRTYATLGNEITANCNCPYDFGGICKHTIALLFEHIECLEEATVPETTSGTPEKVPANQARKINAYFSFNRYMSSKVREIHYKLKVKDFMLMSIKEGKVAIKSTVKDEGDFWERHNSIIHEAIVEFFYDGDELMIKSNQDEKVDPRYLTIPEFKLFEEIQGQNKNFFKHLHPEQLKKRKAAIQKNYGIDEKTFSDHFSLALKENFQIIYRPDKSGGKLLGESNKITKDIESFIGDFERTHRLSTNIYNDAHNKDIKYLELGAAFYSLAIGSAGLNDAKYQVNNIFSITPFAGKPKADGSKLTHHINKLNQLSDNTRIHLTPEEKEFATACELITFDKYIDLINTLKNSSSNHEPGEISLKVQKHLYNTVRPHLKLLASNNYICENTGDDHSKITRTKIKPIKVSDDTVKPMFELETDDIFITLKTRLKAGDQFIDEFNYNTFLFIEVTPKPTTSKPTYYLFDDFESAVDFWQLSDNLTLTAPAAEFDSVFDQLVVPLSKKYTVDMSKMKNYSTKEITPQPKEKRVYISEMGNFITLNPMVLYNNDVKADILKSGDLIERKGKKIIKTQRDSDFEQAFLNDFKSYHPNFKNQFRSDFFYLTADEIKKDLSFVEMCQKLQKSGVELFGLNDLKKVKYSPHSAKISVNVSSDQDWFDAKVNIAFGEEKVSLSQVKKAVLKDDQFVKLGNDKLGILPEEWIEKFKNYFLHGQVKGDEVKISAQKFSVIDELFEEEINDTEIAAQIAEKKQKLAEFTEIKKVKTPKEVKAELRDYQKEGYKWMRFLDDFKWGGILADDMGLGKTLQVLTFLSYQTGQSKKPNLVVVPTTLLFNWKSEIDKFTPHLSSYFHHGTDRTADTKEFKKHNIVLTTYGTMTNDIELLKSVRFNYIVLDESQAIKNPSSKRYKAACLLKGENRLALTGTPIENNTFDLYAQLNFTNPGFLGSMNHFKTHFSTPIDRNKDKERAAQLQRTINPFVMRRTKEQVAKELPPKTEDYLYCMPGEQQKKVYDAYRNKYRDYLLKKIDEDGMQKSKLHVLEGLTKLRQICDSPALLSDREDYGDESIKIEELMRNIRSKTSNHKILVFSQFVKMLHLIEKELKNEGFEYAYLDGSTTQKERKETVNQFQNEEDCRIFLISLKAGGQGLNLTAADYVFLVDPWWNPAVENQAIDRCYRIGQNKNVFAYRMICKNTIEEKIVNLQNQKRALASDIISTDDDVMKNLSKDDIEELFG